MTEPRQADEGTEPGAEDRSLPVVVPKRRRRSRLKITVLCLEILGFIILAPILFGLLAIWAATDNRLRMPEGLEARIATRLDAAMVENRIDVDEIAITLPQGGFTPEVLLTGVSLSDADGLRAYFPEVSVALDGTALLTGRVRPKRVRLDGAGLRLSRDRDGVIDVALATGSETSERGITDTLQRIDTMFGQPAFDELQEVSGSGLVLLLADAVTGQIIQSQDADMRLTQTDGVLSLSMGGSVYASRAARVALEITRAPTDARTAMSLEFEDLAARDLATASPALAWLDLMRAPISGRLLAELSDDGRIDDVAGSLDIGPGEIRPRDDLDPIPFQRIGMALDFAADSQMLRIDTAELISETLSFSATGQAEIQDGGDALTGQLRLSDLSAAPDGLFETPLQFGGGALDLHLVLRPEFELSVGQAVLYDGPLQVHLSGGARVTPAGLRTRIDARIPDLASDEILPYWPAFAIPGTRSWIADNLSGGVLRNFAAAWRIGPGERRSAIRFDFDGLTLSPLATMPPIMDGAGYVSVIDESFALNLTEGVVQAPDGGWLDLSGSTMVIADARPRNPDAEFELLVAGPVGSVGALLALPPVNLLEGSPLDPATLATGEAALRVDLALPFRRTIPREEIQVSGDGVLRDLRTDTLVAGRVMTADSLSLTLDAEALSIAGHASLDGVGLSGRWSRPMAAEPVASRAEGRAVVTPETLAALGIALPNGMVSGSGGAEFSLTLPPEGPPLLEVRSDLAGIGLSLPALGYGFGAGATGDFAAEIVLGDVPDIPALSLQAGGLDLAGAVMLAPGGGLTRFELDRFRLGGWADLSGSLLGRGPNALPAVRITGGTMDLRRFTGGAGGGDGLPIEARLDRLTVTEGIALTDLSADLAPGLAGDFLANVNGAAPIRGTLSPGANGIGVRVFSDNGGAVMRAAGVFENGYGGQMDLALSPTGAEGTYLGELSIQGARIRNAPAMAELLNAISVVGLLEQLDGEGINLGEIDARFRITPAAIFLDEGAALGPSMGISMDGIYDISTRRYDMQGVISPLYILNGALGALFAPRREGLFGFSYRLTGTNEASNVSVNPLSILTPGIFREIFRRPPPEPAAPTQ